MDGLAIEAPLATEQLVGSVGTGEEDHKEEVGSNHTA